MKSSSFWLSKTRRVFLFFSKAQTCRNVVLFSARYSLVKPRFFNEIFNKARYRRNFFRRFYSKIVEFLSVLQQGTSLSRNFSRFSARSQLGKASVFQRDFQQGTLRRNLFRRFSSKTVLFLSFLQQDTSLGRNVLLFSARPQLGKASLFSTRLSTHATAETFSAVYLAILSDFCPFFRKITAWQSLCFFNEISNKTRNRRNFFRRFSSKTVEFLPFLQQDTSLGRDFPLFSARHKSAKVFRLFSETNDDWIFSFQQDFLRLFFSSLGIFFSTLLCLDAISFLLVPFFASFSSGTCRVFVIVFLKTREAPQLLSTTLPDQGFFLLS